MSTVALSVISTLGAALALVVAVASFAQGRRANWLTNHYDLAAASDQMIAVDPRMLRFRGIDADSVEAVYGVTPGELAYLLQVFNGGSVSHKTRRGERRAIKPFPPGSYYYDFLVAEPTQRAFPLIKLMFDSRNPFIAACEETIRRIRARTAQPDAG